MKVLGGVAAIVLVASTILHFAYREVPGIVMGQEFELSAGVTGTVARVHKRENEHYRRGDELVTLESDLLRAQIATVEHEIAELERGIALERSESGIERRRLELQAQIATIESELRSNQLEMESLARVVPRLHEWRDLTAERAARGEDLRRQDAITNAELEERRQRLYEADSKLAESTSKQEILAARIAKQEEILALQRSRLRGLTAERTAMVADLELELQARAGERDRLQAERGGLRLVADHDGVVTAVLRPEGEFVSGGSPVLRVMRDEDVWIEAYLPVGDKGYVRPGDVVEVTGEIPVGSLSGRVSKVLPVLKPLPSSHQNHLGRQENFAVLVITMDDGALARSVLSPAQHVTARIRRRLLGGDLDATAQNRE
jgi:multidrug resistance efflux pump